MEAMIDFIFLVSKITEDGDRNHEIKRQLLHGRKAVTNIREESGNSNRFYFLGLQNHWGQ